MQPGARAAAAVEILGKIFERGGPASVALADWGREHRFAGSGDRAAIGNLVFDALRKKQSLSYLMGDNSPRALVLGALRFTWGMKPDQIAAICGDEAHGPGALSDEEAAKLRDADLSSAPPWVRGDYPEWLQPSFEAMFGDEAAEEGAALAARAPIDLRVNTLKATRDKVLKALAAHGAAPTPYSPIGVRLPAREGPSRGPNVEADPAHGRGWFEVQDEASQIAALLAGAGPRMQICDLCAGSGGKTLAMAAAMQNTGQIHAYDSDPARFRPIFERLKRAGARNVQTLKPGDETALDALTGKMDLVLIDAPCSGTGAWRRHPDAKWRLTPAQLAERQATQRTLLERGAALLKPGGALAYITCSVLPEENASRIAEFLQAHPDFAPRDTRELAEKVLSARLPASGREPDFGLLLTPRRHGTDGFFITVLNRLP